MTVTRFSGRKKRKPGLRDNELLPPFPDMESSHRTPLEDTILTLDSLYKQDRLEYAIFGGIAAIVYGSGRTTIDIDLIVIVELDALEHLYYHFLKEFEPVKEEPLEFFRTYYVLPAVHKRLGTRVDLSAALSRLKGERSDVRRGFATGPLKLHFARLRISSCSNWLPTENATCSMSRTS
jgi:hypothetical protein